MRNVDEVQQDRSSSPYNCVMLTCDLSGNAGAMSLHAVRVCRAWLNLPRAPICVIDHTIRVEGCRTHRRWQPMKHHTHHVAGLNRMGMSAAFLEDEQEKLKSDNSLISKLGLLVHQAVRRP